METFRREPNRRQLIMLRPVFLARLRRIVKFGIQSALRSAVSITETGATSSANRRRKSHAESRRETFE